MRLFWMVLLAITLSGCAYKAAVLAELNAPPAATKEAKAKPKGKTVEIPATETETEPLNNQSSPTNQAAKMISPLTQ